MSDVKLKINFPFIAIPKRMARDRSISAGAKDLYMVMMASAEWSTMEAAISQKDLAERIDATVRTVQNYIEELETAKYVAVEYDPVVHVTTYTLWTGEPDGGQAKQISPTPQGGDETGFASQAKQDSPLTIYPDLKNSDVHLVAGATSVVPTSRTPETPTEQGVIGDATTGSVDGVAEPQTVVDTIDMSERNGSVSLTPKRDPMDELREANEAGVRTSDEAKRRELEKREEKARNAQGNGHQVGGYRDDDGSNEATWNHSHGRKLEPKEILRLSQAYTKEILAKWPGSPLPVWGPKERGQAKLYLKAIPSHEIAIKTMGYVFEKWEQLSEVWKIRGIPTIGFLLRAGPSMMTEAAATRNPIGFQGRDERRMKKREYVEPTGKSNGPRIGW